MAAFWLAYGRDDEHVVEALMHDLGLDEDGARTALDQARSWLTTPDH